MFLLHFDYFIKDVSLKFTIDYTRSRIPLIFFVEFWTKVENIEWDGKTDYEDPDCIS